MWRTEDDLLLNGKGYCEGGGIKSFDAWVLTKSNSWSNYAFVFLGFCEITIAIRDMTMANQIRAMAKSNHIRKHPEWLVYHGLILIYGGVGSFAFHASFTDMAHLFDITGVFAMLGFPATYALVNLFMEDLNRFLWVGDIFSKIAAPLSFVFSIFIGFWIVAKRGTWENLDSSGVLAIMAFTLMGTIPIKWVKEKLIFGREYKINLWVVVGSLVSIAIAAVC
jgi:hypothetical protein